jgi:hypothetical protein
MNDCFQWFFWLFTSSVGSCLCVLKHDILKDELRNVLVAVIECGIKMTFNWNVLCCGNFCRHPDTASLFHHVPCIIYHLALVFLNHDISIDMLRNSVVTMIVSCVKMMFYWNVLCCSNFAGTLILLDCFINHHVQPCLCVLKHDISIDQLINVVIAVVICCVKIMFYWYV